MSSSEELRKEYSRIIKDMHEEQADFQQFMKTPMQEYERPVGEFIENRDNLNVESEEAIEIAGRAIGAGNIQIAEEVTEAALSLATTATFSEIAALCSYIAPSSFKSITCDIAHAGLQGYKAIKTDTTYDAADAVSTLTDLAAIVAARDAANESAVAAALSFTAQHVGDQDDPDANGAPDAPDAHEAPDAPDAHGAPDANEGNDEAERNDAPERNDASEGNDAPECKGASEGNGAPKGNGAGEGPDNDGGDS